ncbi:hypothetical protein E5083_21905 [Streptomyces bauhiniae]|uniref:Uncharacterized protein n=1 Tax=Streptomyces bauhiniae TaxID=2340725 RepID=A0A4Z1D098_9ACTN|nr:hypothetical protein [Streptomyces bauhiniae]TGN74824.1 hypothetical protein E5083_21905 [Streptomyces bauhiniae]
MGELDAARLQIYSSEQDAQGGVVCVVRCVGGIARVGQDFYFTASASGIDVHSPIRLERILRYEKPADFLDPPHSAKVCLSGEGGARLERGVIITTLHSE